MEMKPSTIPTKPFLRRASLTVLSQKFPGLEAHNLLSKILNKNVTSLTPQIKSTKTPKGDKKCPNDFNAFLMPMGYKSCSLFRYTNQGVWRSKMKEVFQTLFILSLATFFGCARSQCSDCKGGGPRGYDEDCNASTDPINYFSADLIINNGQSFVEEGHRYDVQGAVAFHEITNARDKSLVTVS